MMKNKLFRVVFAVAAVAAVSLPGSAQATSWSWNLTGSDSSYLSSISVTSGGHVLKARAYSSASSDGSGALSSAYVRRYSGGIGVSNCISGTCDETSSPNHSVDTAGKNDFLLLEFDSLMSAQAFKIGWKNTDADIQVWTGAQTALAGLNLTGVCATGCVNSLSALGFNAVPRYDNVVVGASNTINAPTQSRYVLVSGELGALGAASAGNDYFKFSALTAGMPAPGTLVLLGVALFGMLTFRRKQKF